MYKKHNIMDNTPLEFANYGWWIIHVIAITLLVFFGILAKDRLMD